jgi:hypothetical protein
MKIVPPLTCNVQGEHAYVYPEHWIKDLLAAKENAMPKTAKGQKIMKNMKSQYGAKKGEQVFYASKNKGKIKGVEKKGK